MLRVPPAVIGVVVALTPASISPGRSAAPAPPVAAPPAVAPPLRVLIIGGGPDREYNQISLEYNVSYVQRLLPPDASVRVLYTRGDRAAQNVQYMTDAGAVRYEVPTLAQIDGPSTLGGIDRELARLATLPPAPAGVLLDVTGHGGTDDDPADTEQNNSYYATWGDGELSVRHLARRIAALPAGEPVTVVMAQCFSGSFANLLYQDGRPDAALVNRPVRGFFACVPQREAAGCTPDVNQADYKDFTSYFFSALSGRDRLGRRVAGADYNHDGRVGMDEALAYAVIHDDSIDTPVCTSDFLLRRYVKLSDPDVMATPYASVVEWATPAQRAVLDALSKQLRYTGGERLRRAYERFRRMPDDAESDADVRTYRFVITAKSVVLAHELALNGTPEQKAQYAALKADEAQGFVAG